MTRKPVVSPELEDAVWSTLYYDERSSPTIIFMLTGRTFSTPPLPPTEEQKIMAREIVEGLLFLHYTAFADAVRETAGEEIDLPPFDKSLIDVGGI